MATVVCGALAGCFFDLADHPAACERTADCSDGFFCYQNLCVMSGQAGGPAGGNGGSDGDAAVALDGGGHGGTGGAGGSSNDGAVGTDSGGGGASGDAATGGVDSGGDAASGPVAPYSACAGTGDCNPGETCRMAEGKGVCAAPCASASDCEKPAGDFEAVVTCGTDDHQCRLDCSLSVGGGPPAPKSCPSGMTCVTEPAMFTWQLGTTTCYP